MILNPDPNSNLMQEEIFGPVLAILTYTNLEEAVQFVNKREHPLALYIFAENESIKEYIRSNTTSGAVCINDTLMHHGNPEIPFGGKYIISIYIF